jgi:hypothetical protein
MSKKDLDTFHLNVRFTVAVKTLADAAAAAAITAWCRKAESLFNAKPALKIKAEVRHNDKAVDTTLAFASQKELDKFMDRDFDNLVGDKQTEGCMQVLVVDSLAVGGDGGTVASAFFPHWVQPFRRKHGIVIEVGAPDFVFAHELGHVFSLKHSFDSYIGFTGNCNKDFEKKPGGSRSGSTINLMDYTQKSSDTIVLNACQKDRAADQRRAWLTADGKTNYRELRGMH